MAQYTGKNVDDILETIALEQGVNKEDIVYKVIDQSGFAMFSKTTIEAYTDNDCMNDIETYIKNVFDAMEIAADINVNHDEDDYIVNINTDKNGLVIGVNGKNLYALELLTKQALSNKYHHRFFIKLDVNNYFKDKEQKLARMAHKWAAEVGRTKMDLKLDPMPNYDRKVIHKVLKDVHYVDTKSYGEGKDRYLVIHYDRENDLKHNNKLHGIEREED
ncbi:MAG: KH domain-containing protein [Bacilli bacterium]|jgi:spoIIIJ-associated protein|nr:KH domain-containing protein [Bacilli bacterium]